MKPQERRKSPASARKMSRSKTGTPDSFSYTVCAFLARHMVRHRGYTTVEDGPLRKVEPPYLLLVNHESFEDYSYVHLLAHPRRPSFLVNEYYRTRPVLKTIARRSGIVSKKLFTGSLPTAVEILRTIRKGYPLVIFPESRLSPDGRTNPIAESGASLYRALKRDLVLTRIEGAYFAHPKWRKRFPRCPVTIRVVRVLRGEELQGMSNEEIDRAIFEGISFDDSVNTPAVYPQRNKAAGLENLLYRCAFCGALYQTAGQGNDFVCRACGRKLTFDDTYHFTEAPGSIPAYYDAIRAMESAGLDRLSLSAPVRTRVIGEDGRTARRERGVCTLTPEAFTYRSDAESFSIPTEDLPALAFSCGKEFELYHDERLHFFYPLENPAQAARWALAVDLLAEARRRAGEPEGGE